MILQPHTLAPNRGARHRPKRVGRGNASGHGTYSTRGGKGQTARSGGSRGLRRLGFRPLLLQTPQLRGFRSQQAPSRQLTLRILELKFNAGDTVSRQTLRERQIIPAGVSLVKIINTGILTKALTVAGIPCSRGAAEQIRAAGGTVSS
ncbi:MAG: 50S ribosomal protein L15 [Candidatus Magasanikbacteria bacterium]|nr:50S ribosomal protein L15 [Candidatus Magasanikbacteria bacterium]